MEYKPLGKTGEKIPELGMGSWLIRPDSVEALKYGFGLGMKFVDTAEMYGTEPIVGEAIKGRKDIFVASKVLPTHFRYDDVLKSCDASLRKLGIKTLDLYQLHWPNPAVPIEETMRVMEALVKQGKIRHIGVSNFSVEELRAAQDALKGNEIVSNQVEYSLLVRDIEEDILKYCSKERITIIAYSPLGHGHLYDRKYAKLLDLLSEIGKRHGGTATQVALAWLLAKKPVVAIPKASGKKHMGELAGSADLKLDKKDIEAISRALPGIRKRSMAGTFGGMFKAGLHVNEWAHGRF